MEDYEETAGSIITQKEVSSPNMFIVGGGNKGANDNIIAIVVIFVAISILFGIICFLCGSAVGGGIGYNKSKSEMEKSMKGMVELDERDCI